MDIQITDAQNKGESLIDNLHYSYLNGNLSKDVQDKVLLDGQPRLFNNI